MKADTYLPQKLALIIFHSQSSKCKITKGIDFLSSASIISKVHMK